MTAPEIRTDYDTLAAIARQFGHAAQQHHRQYQRVKRAADRLAGGSWEGNASDAFRLEMQSVVLPAMLRLINAFVQSKELCTRTIAILQEAEAAGARLFQGQTESNNAVTMPMSGPGVTPAPTSGPSPSPTPTPTPGPSPSPQPTPAPVPAPTPTPEASAATNPTDGWYQAHGYENQNGTWVFTGTYLVTDVATAVQVMGEAGITLAGSNWSDQEIIAAAQGVADLVGRMGKGYEYLDTLIKGDVVFSKPQIWEDPRVIPLVWLNQDRETPAYAPPPILVAGANGAPSWLFDGNTVMFAPDDPNAVSKYIVVHELAHLIDWDYGASANMPPGDPVTPYAGNNIPGTRWEEWGESVAVWVYGEDYENHTGAGTADPLDQAQVDYIESILIPDE